MAVGLGNVLFGSACGWVLGVASFEKVRFRGADWMHKLDSDVKSIS